MKLDERKITIEKPTTERSQLENDLEDVNEVLEPVEASLDEQQEL